jgi:hypothetical protein
MAYGSIPNSSGGASRRRVVHSIIAAAAVRPSPPDQYALHMCGLAILTRCQVLMLCALVAVSVQPKSSVLTGSPSLSPAPASLDAIIAADASKVETDEAEIQEQKTKIESEEQGEKHEARETPLVLERRCSSFACFCGVAFKSPPSPPYPLTPPPPPVFIRS